MQATSLLLYQHCLLHIQVHLLQEKEDLALLQCLTEADELFRLGTKGAHPGKVVLLGSLSLDVVGIVFRVHPPSSHSVMSPSLLPSSLSRARSWSPTSMTTADITTVLGGEGTLHQSRCRDQRYDKKQTHVIASAE
jgi:hypothetical protein